MHSGLTLVTGATGLVGNNVVRMLLERGRAVRVLARNSSDPRPLEGLDVEIVRGDVCDADSVRRACDGVGCVIHSAGYVQIGRRYLDRHRAINVEGTRHAAESARAVGARLIHVSSVDALAIQVRGSEADEETPLAPAPPIPYVLSKREAEQVVLRQVAAGLDAVIVNPALMLGPWDWKPSSGQMLLAVARGKAFFAPRGRCGFCDVRDVAEGILAAVERGRTGRRYILGGVNLTYLAAWQLFADVTGGRRPLCRAGPLMLWVGGKACDLWGWITGQEPVVNSGAIALAKMPKNLSSRRAQTELGYRIRPLRQSAQDAWDWFQQHGYAPRPGKSKDPRHVDLRHRKPQRPPLAR